MGLEGSVVLTGWTVTNFGSFCSPGHFLGSGMAWSLLDGCATNLPLASNPTILGCCWVTTGMSSGSSGMQSSGFCTGGALEAGFV